MINWNEYNAQLARDRSRSEQQKAADILTYAEMCDCCGISYIGIKRATFYSRSGVKYVIRYCSCCNPQLRWQQIGL